jgi:NTE family protein
MKQRIILATQFFLLISVLATAQTALPHDDQFMIDVPIIYGEESALSRFQSDEPIGLLLSGGSARAFAHIGVLKRLEEAGIVPDFLVTNSMGSIVGLLYAAGLSPDTIHKFIRDIDLSTLFDPVVPLRGGILNVRRFTALLHSFFGDLNIEDFSIPIFVITEDLKTKRQVIFAEGDFYKIMEAAFALPAYFNPVEYRGHLLIDGGLSNLVPVDICYRYSDRVIVSTTFYNKELNLNNPFTILNVAIDIPKSRPGIVQLKYYNPALIRCAVEQYSFMDWEKLDEIFQRGYESADNKIDELQDYFTGRDLTLERRQVIEAVEEGLNRYRRYGDPPLLEPFFGMVIGWAGTEDRYMDPADSIYAGLIFETGRLHTALNISYSPGFLHGWDAIGAQGALSVNTPWGWNNSIGGKIFWNPQSFTPSPREIFGWGKSIISLFPSDTLRFRPFITGECLQQDNKTQSIISVGLSGAVLQDFKERVGLSGGILLEDLFIPGYFITGNLNIPIGPLFTLKGENQFRSAIGPSLEIRRYKKESVRGMNNAGGVSDFFLSKTDFMLSIPGFRPSMGEMIIFTDAAIGIFYDFLYEEESYRWSAGGSIECNVSFLGLKSTMVSLFGGWYGSDLFFGILVKT